MMVLAAACALASTRFAEPPKVKVYVLDGGRAILNDSSLLSDVGEAGGRPIELANPCFLVRHGDRWLLWDTGFAAASPERKGIERDLDAIAAQLRRLQDAHVPVLWRPLHEAEGGWFWWGAKGPEPARWLYRFAYDRLTKRNGLHNLVWVWKSSKADWYPGDDVVDVMSVDHYPTDRRDALSSSWDDLLARFGGRKPLALAEFPGACSPLSVPTSARRHPASGGPGRNGEAPAKSVGHVPPNLKARLPATLS